MMTKEQRYWRKSGEHFGYPECCIKAFLTGDYSEYNPYNGTGYRPCESCEELSMKEVIIGINKNRAHPYPFPDGAGFVEEWKDLMYD